MKKSLAWMSAAQIGVMAMQFASSVVVARVLTPRELGVFAVGLACVGLLSIVQTFGLSSMIVREEKLSPEITRTAFLINAIIAALLAALIAAAAGLGSRFFGDPGVGDILGLLALTPLFGIPSFVPGAMLEREGRFKRLGLIALAVAMTTSTATIVFCLNGSGVMGLAYAQLLGAAMLAALLIANQPHSFSLKVSTTSWRRVLEFGSQMLAVSGVTTLSQRTSELMLGRMIGLPELGLYNRASGVNQMLWGAIHNVVSRILLSDFAQINRAGEALRDRYLATVGILTALLWPAFAGLALLALTFIHTVFGAKWVAAALPLAILAIASILLVSIAMTWELFTATGRLREQTKIELVRAPVAVLFFAIGCQFGLAAVAASRVLDAMLAIALYTPHIRAMTNTTWGDFKKIYCQGAILALVAVAPLGLLIAWEGTMLLPITLAFVGVLVGVGFWAALLVYLRHPLAQEVIRTLRSRRSRSSSSSFQDR